MMKSTWFFWWMKLINMFCQPKKTLFCCLIPYTIIPWNHDISGDDYHTVKISYRCKPRSEHWKANVPLLQPLNQCWQHSCVCFLKLASAPEHSTRTQHLWSTLARSVPSETLLGKPLYDPGHCTVTPFFVESNNSNSQILRELFAMRCHVEHPAVRMRELYSNIQIWTALKQDTHICMILSSRQNMMNRACVFAWLNNV